MKCDRGSENKVLECLTTLGMLSLMKPSEKGEQINAT